MSISTSFDSALGYAALTVAGQVRKCNEDALLCCPQLCLWAVADGMGGHGRGELASALALETLHRLVACGQDLRSAVQGADAAVLAAAETRVGGYGMGASLVAVRFAGADFQLAWAGDSRAYRIGGDSIRQLTRDHTWVQTMVDAGRLTQEEASRHPLRNLVTRCLGLNHDMLAVELVQGRLDQGERLLLCSDGLTRELSDARIQHLCAHTLSLDTLVGALVGAAERMGGSDNISCIALGLAAPPARTEERPRGFLRRLLKSAGKMSGARLRRKKSTPGVLRALSRAWLPTAQWHDRLEFLYS
ncbi:PP2C family protein-serine/threonine phosphatase [Azotobacter vinelandii]